MVSAMNRSEFIDDFVQQFSNQYLAKFEDKMKVSETIFSSKAFYIKWLFLFSIVARNWLIFQLEKICPYARIR